MMTTRSQPSLLLTAQDFQRSFVPESLRSSLRQSQQESAWQFLHAAAPNPSEFPTPASSEYHLPLATRPKSAGISQFTARENRRLGDQSGLSTMLTPVNLAASSSARLLRSPTDKDFQRMIDRLQKLQSGNVGNRRILLSEGKDEEVMLEENEVQHFKIQTLGKHCPLKVTIQREKGSVIVYMSRTDQEPTEGDSEAVYKKDFFAISDPGLRFKTEYIYLAAKALNQVAFTIAIKYGKRLGSESSYKLRREQEQQEEDARLDEFRKVMKPKTAISGTNFIKRNLVVLPLTSPKVKKELRIKKKQATERRQAVLERKQSILAEKRQRTFLVLHRHELRAQAEAKAREIMELIERKESFESAWFLLIYNQRFTDTLYAKVVKRNQELAHAAKLAHAATTIQVYFRKMVRHLDRTGLALRTSRNALLMFGRLHFRSMRATAKKNIMNSIRQAFRNSIPPAAAARMLMRSKLYVVALVKKVWKLHLEKRKRRWDELTALWNSCMDEILGNLQKPTKARGKASKKKKDPAVKYMEISSSQKLQTLTSWTMNAKRKYRDQLRTYITSQHDLVRKGLKALMNLGGSMSLVAMPDFHYLPTREEMTALINKCVGASPAASPPKKAR